MDPRRVVSETVSDSSAIEQRPGFIRLLNKLEQDDVLIVTKLDRLGRNAIDVATTVAKLSDMGVRVHCLALRGVDLTGPAGRMTMGVTQANGQRLAGDDFKAYGQWWRTAAIYDLESFMS